MPNNPNETDIPIIRADWKDESLFFLAALAGVLGVAAIGFYLGKMMGMCA